ncbi:MAG: sigma-E factor negative regulatory protein [Chromatiales bacterium]|nr:sigma-E factor negative regulatory protein [Chromatiales bacterium]
MKLVTNNSQPAHYSKQDSTQISSMVDGELTPTEMSEQITPLLSGGREREQWQHYHLVRDLLQHQLPDNINPNFTQNVMKRLESEPTVLAPAGRGRAVVKQIVGVGLAASVAAVALLTSYNLNVPNDSQADQMVADAQLNQKTLKKVEHWERDPKLEQWNKSPNLDQFSPYLANHAAYSAGTGNQGFMPYARVVGYSSGK